MALPARRRTDQGAVQGFPGLVRSIRISKFSSLRLVGLALGTVAFVMMRTASLTVADTTTNIYCALEAVLFVSPGRTAHCCCGLPKFPGVEVLAQMRAAIQPMIVQPKKRVRTRIAVVW